MSKNTNLHKAKEAKNDEFYTQLSDIEKELNHYRNHFKGASVLCNCDDPFESNFFKYFALNFKFLGLKKLVATCYDGSQVAYTESRDLFNFEDEAPKARAYKIEITEENIPETDGWDLNNVKTLTKKYATLLKGDGDFRSEECIELLKGADIVVTNPPFSLFREYVAQLVEYGKKFLILGTVNAITYKEIFPLIKANKMWIGNGFNMSLIYKTPYENNLEANRRFVESKGYDPNKNFIKVPACAWYTNLDLKKRHESLILYREYKGHESDYPKYDNYDAINVDKVQDIPCDYDGVMGVPITFLDKFNPEQFEIIGLGIANLGLEIGVRGYLPEHRDFRKNVQHKGAVDGDLYMVDSENHPIVPYARILIKRVA